MTESASLCRHFLLDVAVKRQLSSLLYVNGVCEKRIEQLHAGLDEPDLLPMVGGTTSRPNSISSAFLNGQDKSYFWISKVLCNTLC